MLVEHQHQKAVRAAPVPIPSSQPTPQPCDADISLSHATNQSDLSSIEEVQEPIEALHRAPSNRQPSRPIPTYPYRPVEVQGGIDLPGGYSVDLRDRTTTGFRQLIMG